MAVDLKQHLNLEDYLGVVAVWCVFFTILFVLSVFINFTCINESDDITALEQFTVCKMKLATKKFPSVKNNDFGYGVCDLTNEKMQKIHVDWGYKKNLGMRMGPHRRSVIARQIPHTVRTD